MPKSQEQIDREQRLTCLRLARQGSKDHSPRGAAWTIHRAELFYQYVITGQVPDPDSVEPVNAKRAS